MPPTVLLNSLHHVRRKVKFLSVIIGVGIVLASIVGVLLATILLDYALNLPSFPRVIVILMALGGIGATVYYQIVKPALTKLSISDVAGRLEHAFPAFDDRLRSTVDFVRGDLPGSDVMKARVVTEATDFAQKINLDNAIVMRPVIYSVGGALGAIVLAIVLGSISPGFTHTALARLFNPISGPQWPKRFEISPSPLPGRVAVGQRVDVQMKLTKGDSATQKAIVYYQYDEGPVQQEYMNRSAAGVYTASLDAKGAHMKVWMKSGDDTTAQTAIAVLPRLQINQVEALVTPPPYAKLPAASVNLNNGPALVTVGSGMSLVVSFNKPLDPHKDIIVEAVSPQMKLPHLVWDRSNAAQPQAHWSALDSFRIRIKATDTDGFTNAGLEEYEIIARPDQAPTVMIEEPRRNVEQTAVATLPLRIVAEDDFGINMLKLVVDRISTAASSTTQPAVGHWEIPLTDFKKIDGSVDRLRFREEYAWDLGATLKNAVGGLKPGDVLEYYAVAQDNFDLPNVDHPDQPHMTHEPVASGKLRVTILSQDELSAKMEEILHEAGQKAKEIQDAQVRTQAETATLQKDTKNKPNFSKGDHDAAERMINEQSTIDSQTKTVAAQIASVQKELAQNKSPRQDLADVAKDVSQQLDKTAENPMKDAVDKLAQANQPADPKATPPQQKQQADARDGQLAQAQTKQSQASDELKKAMDRLGSVGTLADVKKEWEKIQDKQKELDRQLAKVGENNLGKKPEEMKPEDRKKLDEIAKAQADLAKESAKATQDTQKASEQTQKSDPASSKAMSQAAEQSKSQAITPQQQQAADQAQQNHQSPAQTAQKQAELGLQVVIDTLQAAELRKLEELVAQLEKAKEHIADLVRRQAGHNMDNLAMQGGDALKLISDELRTDADRINKDHQPPVPTLPQATDYQEQTERNTRNVIKEVEDLPDGAKASAALTLAAGKMGYAISSLRDGKLPEAYDPSQTGALAALKDALKVVDEQKDKADQKNEQQKKAKIRDAYVKLRDDQIKVARATVALNAVPHGADGTPLKREDAAQLRALPDEQGKLADRANDIGKDLSSLGSIIYTWANNDIVRSMRDLKDDLAKPETGVPTQAEQARVVAQLNAMIDDLVEKKKDRSKFAKDDGGGGGGGGGKPPAKMPTEAELRLLKDLQKSVNNSDIAIADLPKAQQDKAKLVALGGRQRELRGVLDQLFKKAGVPEGLGPEPTKSDQLPEEAGAAGADGVDNQELEKTLLEDKPTQDAVKKDAQLIGDRMSRSGTRLADNQDPGHITQVIQDRILKNMDDLIEQAQKAQSSSKPKPHEGQGQQASKPGEGEQPGNSGSQPGKPQKGGTEGAKSDEITNGAGESDAHPNDKIKETLNGWGKESPRIHDAVMEAANEKVIERYKNIVEDYYRYLATKSDDQK